MATTYPASPAYSYPLVRSLEYQTRIVTGTNGTEQRWSLTAGLESFELSHPHLTLSQRDTLIAFFDSCKGDFAQDISWDFDGATWTDLYLDSEQFSCVETQPTVWAVKMRLCQTARVPDDSVPPSTFPLLTTGAAVQLPYTHSRDFDNAVVKTEGGRFARYNRAAVRRSWTAGGTVLNDTEALTLWGMFSAHRGRWGSFDFVDPDSNVTYTARFDQDKLDWTYAQNGIHSMTCKLIQVL